MRRMNVGYAVQLWKLKKWRLGPGKPKADFEPEHRADNKLC